MKQPLTSVELGLSALLALIWSSSGHSADALATDSPWLLGDLGGSRQQLATQGLNVGLYYLSEFANNTHGGHDTRNETVSSDQTALIINYNMAPTLGIVGDWSLAITNRDNHQLLNTTRLNDPRGPLTNLSQEVWGSGSFTRITHFTYHRDLLDGAAGIRVGRMSPTEEYFPDPHGCDFQALQNCGTVPGNSNIWYGWPVATWGLSTSWHITEHVYVKAGVYQQNPDDLKKSRAWSFSFKGGRGEIYPVLLGWQPQWGAKRYAGNYFIGAFYSNVDSSDVYEGASGGAQAMNPSAGFKQRTDRKSAWVYASQQLTGPGGSSAQGLQMFANAEVNDPRTSVIHYVYGAGLYYTGPFANRPRDVIGFATTVTHINDRWARNQALNNVMQGYDSDAPLYSPGVSQELNSELYYRWQATGSVYLQPGVQYYRHPGAVDSVPDAVVLALRMGVSF
ncbi:carbohydrate porin (plasmid) [Pseudomonas sp. App30]|uniref:carbohydrate porin n=1 Tax=Pseudomonas sp. App30 TaxID=3068990 RepID=UPI003A8105D4